ncbi:MAG TPA: HYR domain-containing protein [Thermoanaerobaculia bacterium]|nr:HYR domain-containing protein [Thermoanaerobaculia bacterium]
MRRLVAVAVLTLCAASAAAGTIESYTPFRIAANSGEHFLSIEGWDLNGTRNTIVVFAGPAGTFEMSRSAWTNRSVTVYIPNEVVRVAGRYSLTVIAINDGGNTTSGPVELLVEGIPPGPPRIVLPNDFAVEATQSSGAYAFYTAYAYSSVDTAADMECLPKTGSVFPLGDTTVQCRASDSAGTTTASFVVTVRDTRPPTLRMPIDYVTAFPVVNYEADAFDIVDGVLPATCTPAAGSTFPQGQTTVDCSAVDAHGNRTHGTFRVTVDAQLAASAIESLDPPVIRVRSGEWFLTVTGLNLNGAFGTELTFSGPAGSITVKRNAYTDRTVSAWIPQAVVNTAGRYQILITAFDAPDDPRRTRDIGPVDFWVLEDALPPPTLHLPDDFSVEAEGAAGAPVRFEVGSDAPVTCNPASGTLFAIGTTTVRCSATNSGGTTSGSFQVTVRDTTPPVLKLPADIVTSKKKVEYETTASDLVDGSVTPACNPPSGSTFERGTTTVRCSATDRAGNRADGSFTVTVTEEDAPPILNLPANITAEATGSAGAVVTFTVTATAGAQVVCTPASGSTFPLGTTTVQCTAGVTTGSFEVKVVDTTPPALNLPFDITSEVPTVTWQATATDLVDRAVTPVCTPPSGSLFEQGTTTVACSATDAHGNRATGGFQVTVGEDANAPIILTVRPSEGILWPPNHQLVPVTITVDAFDPEGGPVDKRIVNVTSNQPAGDEPDWRITGALTLDLRAERDGDGDRVYTIEVEVADGQGNAARGTCEVRVPHRPPLRAMGH